MSASDLDLSAGHKEKCELWCVTSSAATRWNFVRQEFKIHSAAVDTRFGILQHASCQTAASKSIRTCA